MVSSGSRRLGDRSKQRVPVSTMLLFSIITAHPRTALSIIKIIESAVRGCAVIIENKSIVETGTRCFDRSPSLRDPEETMITCFDVTYGIDSLIIVTDSLSPLLFGNGRAVHRDSIEINELNRGHAENHPARDALSFHDLVDNQE